MGRLRVVRWGSVLAAFALGCGRAASPASAESHAAGTATTVTTTTTLTTTTAAPVPPAPTAPAASTATSAEPVVEAPGPDWKPAELEKARGYVSIYFGSGDFKDPGVLRPIAAWSRGESGVVRVFRRVDPQSGRPAEIGPLAPERGGPKPEQLREGVLWYEWPSDGVQFYWVTSGSIVLAMEERPLARGAQLRREIRGWALKVAVDLATTP